MKVKEIMTKGVENVTSTDTVHDAASKMRKLDVGALPVCDGDRLVGMITDRDITVRAVAEEKDIRSTHVRDCMSGNAVYCFDDQDVREVERLMEENRIRRIPVMDRNKRLVGIVALADISRKLRREESGEILEKVSEPGHAPRA